MRYLSLDIEATGLKQNDYIIELACVPFCTSDRKIEKDLSFHCYIKCPSFEELKPSLSDWVIENNYELINKASTEGLSQQEFKSKFEDYLSSPIIKKYFSQSNKITLFGKSMNAIDLPFLNRDLGQDFMRSFFEHRYLDLSSIAYHHIDTKLLPEKCQSGSNLMKYFNMGDVAHTALDDAINTVYLYFKILDLLIKN